MYVMAEGEVCIVARLNGKIDINADSYIAENPNCNNTCVLLRLYRSAAMTVAYRTETLKRTIESEYGSDVGGFIDALKKHGVELNSNEQIVENIREVSYENDVLTCIEGYINIIKDNHPSGNILYSVLYHTYLKKYKLSNKTIRDNISNDLERDSTICERTYLRYLNEAIMELNSILWSSQNKYLKAITEYVKENADTLTVSYGR